MGNKIVADGSSRFRMTREYKMKIKAIQKQVIDEFALKPRPKNILSRIIMKFKMEAEINKRIRELSSHKNLHI